MGVPRRDYLYLMPYWEIVLTVRGYYRRNILQYELQRIQAFSAAFAFGGNKNNISPRDFIPLPFDDDEGTDDENLTDDEINAMRRIIEAENAKNSKEPAPCPVLRDLIAKINRHLCKPTGAFFIK